jgi:hypothetical protein
MGHHQGLLFGYASLLHGENKAKLMGLSMLSRLKYVQQSH